MDNLEVTIESPTSRPVFEDEVGLILQIVPHDFVDPSANLAEPSCGGAILIPPPRGPPQERTVQN